MALAYLYDPLKQWQDLRGVNNVAGWLEVFISGTDEHAVAYSDFNGTLLPERIPIDNDGRAVVIVDSEKAYRVEVHDASGALRFTQYPVWTQQSGGGVGDLTVIESSDASVAIDKSVIGSVTTYDLSVAKDSAELLDWVRTDGYTMDGADMVPTYSSGTMDVGSHGVILHKDRYYHVTARYIASVTAMPSYNEFAITFAGRKSGGASETYVSRYDIADCSTQLRQEYEVSFDAMPSDDVELYASVSGLATGVSVGLLDMEIHRVYSGLPAMPEGVASKSWVEDNYQPTLTAGEGITIVDNVISSEGTSYTAGSGIDIGADDTISVDFSTVQPKLTAGANISIEGATISAVVPEYADADWDAASGEPGFIHNKPSFSQVAYSGDYDDLSDLPDLSVYATQAELAGKQDVLTAGDNITIVGNTISATVPEYADADWDAASGEPGYIHNKPEIPADNVFVATYGSTTYQELSAAHTDGKAIFVTGVSGALSAIMPMTSFSTNPAMVIFTTVIGDVEYQAKIDQGVWSSTSVSLQADWDEASQLSPAYIANKPTIPAAQVNSDWDATSGISQILNKPEETTLVAGENVTITESGSTITISAQGGGAEQVNADWDATSGVAEILHKPDLSVYAEKSELATVATTGSYNSLTDTPTIPAAQVNADWDATSGLSEILNKPDLSIYAQSADLAAVATTGSYNSLTDTPTIPAAQVNSDWDATSGVAQILNRPTEKDLVAGDNITITESGNTVTISASASAAQVNSDWDATSGVAQILNKPDLSIYAQSADLAAVATTGSYNSLTDKPTIPAAQVNADWDAVSGVAEILNKPSIPSGADLVPPYTLPADEGKVLTVGPSTTYWDTPKGGSVYYVTYGTTTWAQVQAAYAADNKVSFILLDANGVQISTTFELYDPTSSLGNIEFLQVRDTIPQVGIGITIYRLVSSGTHWSLSTYFVNSNVQADWTEANSSYDSYIKNKPDLSVYAQTSSLAAVATTGSYNSLTDTPAIPAAQVNSDWDATSGVSEILNKPDLVDIVAGPGIVVDNPDGNTLRVSVAQADETVLWEQSSYSYGLTSVTLSESYKNFEMIKVYTNKGDVIYMRPNNSQTVNTCSLTHFNGANIWSIPWSFTDNTHFDGAAGVMLYSDSGTIKSVTVDSSAPYGRWEQPEKIVGINRTASN